MTSPALPTCLAEITANRRPETELLLGCARLTVPAAGRARIERLVQADLNWAEVIELAAQHGLRPLLYRHLNDIAPTALPRPVFAQLWSHYEATARRNRALTEDLLRLLELLGSKGITAIPYKGPVLAASIYGNAALREFCDLDILVKPRDLLVARDLLLAAGYNPVFPLKPAQEAAFLRSGMQNHLALVHRQRKTMVELHWRLGSEFTAFPELDDEWWASRCTVRLGPAELPGFRPEELLLVLCLHGAKDQWSRLAWLVDVAELIRQQPQLDWEWVMTTAERLGGRRKLALGLCLAHHLLDAPLPAACRHWIEMSPAGPALAAGISRRFFAVNAPEDSVFEGLNFELTLLEHWPQRVRHALHLILAPSLIEWKLPLPRCLFASSAESVGEFRFG